MEIDRSNLKVLNCWELLLVWCCSYTCVLSADVYDRYSALLADKSALGFPKGLSENMLFSDFLSSPTSGEPLQHLIEYLV